jgi:hypothetical protein
VTGVYSRIGDGLIPIAALVLCTGCYEYTPMPLMRSSASKPETVELLLNERGRLDLLQQLGPDALSVEGALVTRADSSLSIRIASVTSISRSVTKWSGEPLTVQNSQLRDVRMKRISRGKTFLAVGTAVGGVLAFVISRTLAGRGNTAGQGGQPPNEQ